MPSHLTRDQGLDRGRVGVVSLDVDIDRGLERVPGDVQRALQEEVIGAPCTHTDRLAVELVDRGDVAVFLHRDRGRRVVVGGREVQDLGPLLGHRHRTHAHVPTVLPVAGRDGLPLRRLPLDLDAELVGDRGGNVDVEALVLVRLRVQRRLRRVGRVGRNPDDALIADLREQVARAGVCRGACARRAGTGAASVTRRFVVIPSTRCSGQGEHRQQRDERTKLELPHPASSQGGTRAFPVQRPDYRPRGWCGQRDIVHNPPVGLRESAPFRLQGASGEGIQRVPDGVKTETCGSTSSPPSSNRTGPPVPS